MAVTAPGSDLWVLSTPESARADAKSATSSSKSATHGRPHDSDDTLGASFSPALTLMPEQPIPGASRHRLTATLSQARRTPLSLFLGTRSWAPPAGWEGGHTYGGEKGRFTVTLVQGTSHHPNSSPRAPSCFIFKCASFWFSHGKKIWVGPKPKWALSSVREAPIFSKRRAARGLGSRRSSPNSPPSPELSSGDGGELLS